MTLTNYTTCFYGIYQSHRGYQADNSTQISCSEEKKDDLSMKKKPLFFLYLMLQGDNPTQEIQSTRA